MGKSYDDDGWVEVEFDMSRTGERIITSIIPIWMIHRKLLGTSRHRDYKLRIPHSLLKYQGSVHVIDLHQLEERRRHRQLLVTDTMDSS